MFTAPTVTRRKFIVGSAAAVGGLSLGFSVPFPGGAQADAIAPEINAWVVVRPDDTVVIRIARSEMGQGTLTGLAQLVAEELECDWSKVTTEYPTPGENIARNRVWGSFSTGGSRGIRESHDYVRRGGATAREMLIAAAADAWQVPAAECSVTKGVITHGPSGRSVTYGQVATAAAAMTPPAEVALKDPSEWTIAGKPLPRLDTAEARGVLFAVVPAIADQLGFDAEVTARTLLPAMDPSQEAAARAVQVLADGARPDER